ncbi:MAG: tagaturonate epimerase family protein [Anaerolineae bacterium]|nr:tagaturonate epimerase family protein [Anaerolineae bacterium]
MAGTLAPLASARVYPGSIVARDGVLFFLTPSSLGVLTREASLRAGLHGERRDVEVAGASLHLWLCPRSHQNAAAIREALPFLAPKTLGLARSVGFGDRLGLATPGHVRAVRGTAFAPVFAQQSIREMARTSRSPEQVLDDATWGVLQEGWRGGHGADADHLKTPEDVDLCVRAGYTLYTIDPGDHVDNAAESDPPAALAARVEALPWADLESSPQDLRRTYAGRSPDLGPTVRLTADEEAILRAAAKYGRAIAHTVRLYRHLAARMAGRPFELEVSVDETASPTSVVEHWFVASELLRLGVRWVSLAPRFIGRFEKGVDYIGDLRAFEAELARHVAVAQHMGPYKLSLHSGSDKFSVYPAFARLADPLLHLKTAGTSYLAALRAVAIVAPDLFREILAFARERYPEDRASYHVSANLGRVPDPERLSDAELPGVLELFDARQVLHVTFGSVVTARDPGGGYRFRDRLYTILGAHEEAHYEAVSTHLRRHLEAFA